MLADVRLRSGTTDTVTVGEPLAQWQNGIQLLSTTVTDDADAIPHSVAIKWRAADVIHDNLITFVQVLDTEGNVIAQADRRPQDGAWPTSTWRTGDVIDDVLQLEWAADVDEDTWQRVIIGWYGDDGIRVGLREPNAGATFYELSNR